MTKSEINKDIDFCVKEGGNKDLKLILELMYHCKRIYKLKKRILNEKKSELQLETDWKKIFPDKTKPSESEKKAWITLETKDLEKEVDDYEVKYQHLQDLFKLEKLLLQL